MAFDCVVLESVYQSRVQKKATTTAYHKLKSTLLWFTVGAEVWKIFGVVLLILIFIDVITASMDPLLTGKTLHHGNISELPVSPPTKWAIQTLVALLIATVAHREVVVPARSRSPSRSI